MRTIFTKTALLVALLLPMAALAAEKMAVVDPMEALMNSSVVKSRNAQLEKSIESEGQRLRKLRDELVKIEERLQRDGMTMSKSERNKLNDEREEKGFRFQTMQQSINRRVEEDRQELLEEMEPILLRAIEEVAKAKKVDMVISANAVVYGKPEIDITNDVTKRINQLKK